jgi:predicted RNA-binding protein YlxR (DUF448 family)
MIEEKKYNRGASITPNIGASGEMFNSKNMNRSILSNQNSEAEANFEIKTYMNEQSRPQ